MYFISLNCRYVHDHFIFLFTLQSFRPFIITKDMIQKTVFGAGYPSIPSMTIEEFYDQKVKDGTLPPPMAT